MTGLQMLALMAFPWAVAVLSLAAIALLINLAETRRARKARRVWR